MSLPNVFSLSRSCRSTSRVLRLALSLAALLVVAAVPGTTCFAQLPDDITLDADERAVLYQELVRDADEFDRRHNLVKRVVRLARGSVVHIDATKPSVYRGSYVRSSPAEEAGSGVIIALDGKHYVLTNRHLIRFSEPENIRVKLADGRIIKPTKTWEDAGTDVAVLQLKEKKLVPTFIGNSDRLEIGDFVVAIGSPFGLNHSVSYGIISAKGRRDLELATDGVSYQDFLQTDAAINPGNSGGPLLNLRGELVGINTAIASHSGRNEGIGFSIPINMVMVVAKQLIEKGDVTRAFLGVNLDSKFGSTLAVKLGLDRPRGARVTVVRPGTPAEKAKILVDDVILRYGDVWIEDDSHLVNLVGLSEVGRDVKILVYRNGKTMEITATVGDRGKLKP